MVVDRCAKPIRREPTITERKRAEDSLRASEARWRSIFEHSVVRIGTTDRTRRYLSANPALQDMPGYSEEELCSLTLAEVTHPDDIDATERAIRLNPTTRILPAIIGH